MKYTVSKGLLNTLTRIFAFFILLASGTFVIAEVIDFTESFDNKSPPELHLHFTTPVQYISHLPHDYSDESEIQIRFVQRSGMELHDIDQEQRISEKYSQAIPVIDIRYEPDSFNSGIIKLRFKHPVKTMIQESSDKRLLIVSLVAVPEDITVPSLENSIPAGQNSTDRNDVNRYVVNLKSSIRDIITPEILNPGGNEEYTVYITKHIEEGREWQRLSVGFFENEESAKNFVNTFKHQFPDAWVSKADLEEVKNALKKPGDMAGETKNQPPFINIKPTRARTTEARIEELMEEARQAVANNKSDRAIQLYTKILEYPDHKYRQQALEYLGVAREKKNQFAHAIAQYRKYLTIYPEGESADRVKQRLSGLTTASRRIPIDDRKTVDKSGINSWEYYGGISMFYRRDEDMTENIDDPVTQSSLFNDLDLTARKRTATVDMQARFSGSYLSDFLDDGGGDETSVSSLYFDMTNKKNGLTLRAGRQSRSTGGVLGRLDGLSVGYKFTDKITLNSIVGFPVQSTRDQIKTDRYLYGVNADFGTYADTWDFNAFLIEQKSNSLLDRRAIGGEARYFDKKRSLLTYLDYDVSYTSLNTLLVIGTWKFDNKTTLNASFNFRNSPILTTSNAIISTSVNTIDDLQDLFTDQEIRKLAENRSAESKTLTVGISRPLYEKLQFNADMTVSNFSSTKGSDLNGDGIINTELIDVNGDGLLLETDIQPFSGTGNEYFYNFQLIGNSLLKTGDTGIIGLRFFDTKSSNTTSLSLNSRYPITNQWRINPRFKIDYRETNADDTTQWVYSPEIRTDYRWRKRYRFEFELGGKWSTRELQQGNDDASSFYYSLGFRADF